MGEGRGKDEPSRTLIQSLGLGRREMLSLVGAGGKTTLLFRLARELVLEGKRVITTTTTKILEPSSEESTCLLVDSDDKAVVQFLKRHLSRLHHITIARERLGKGKLRGISSEFAETLWGLSQIDALLIEADGAAGHPVKAPREGEPVIPPHTTVIVGLLGVDGMELELKEEHIFRSKRVSQLTGVPLGGRMTDEAMAILATHSEGIFKGAPSSSRVVVFLNKVDTPDGIRKGRCIAQKILRKRHHQIDRVVLGQLTKEPPVTEVFQGDRS